MFEGIIKHIYFLFENMDFQFKYYNVWFKKSVLCSDDGLKGQLHLNVQLAFSADISDHIKMSEVLRIHNKFLSNKC